MQETHTVSIEASQGGQRLDKCLAAALPAFSRSRLQQLIAGGQVSGQGGTITDAAHKVKPGEAYSVSEPPPEPMALQASDVTLSVVYEDAHLLVIDKPAGMTVHPAPGHSHDTLVNALLTHCGDSLSGIGGVSRPGIVHRIDKDTSGLLVVAKHDAAHRHLAAQLAARTLKREYRAVVFGRPNPLSGTIEGNIARSHANRQKMAVVKAGGKSAITHYRTLETFANASLVACVLESGRTHQIRVHMTHIGHPLLGDPVYGRKTNAYGFARQALHAAALTLIHPASGERMDFSVPLPDDMQALLDALRTADS
jgi:23S rRNA pseudouridine1911/1915/1917 synthase